MTLKAKALFLALCILLTAAACGPQQESISSENLPSPTPISAAETSMPSSENPSFAEDTKSPDLTDAVSYPLVYPMEGDYDYSFYLNGLYLSSDRISDQLCIQPIRFSASEDNTYQIEEYTEEILALPLKPETQFQIINWNRDPQMAEQSLNQPLSSLVAVCVFDNPRTFFKYMKQNHGEDLAARPMALNLDQDGYVDLVVELYVP